MKHFIYIVICAFVGLLGGVIFGALFDSFYTKKNQWAEKQKLQIVIFGTLGVVGGAYLGIKIANEEEEKERREKEYQDSIVIKECSFCSNNFRYSTLEFEHKEYCDSCIKNIRQDFYIYFRKIEKLLQGIENLKRKSAIKNRLVKIKEFASELLVYENVDLPFISKKPSAIIEYANNYLNNID